MPNRFAHAAWSRLVLIAAGMTLGIVLGAILGSLRHVFCGPSELEQMALWVGIGLSLLIATTE